MVPNLFVTADRSMHDYFTAAGQYSMMVVVFQQPKWSYQYEPSDKVAVVVCSFAPSPTLSLYAPTLSRYAPSFHWKNRQITCPDICPFERGAVGTDVPFYNSIIDNFIVYQDRIETDLLNLCVHPEDSEWSSVISVIIFEVNIVA